MVALAEERLAAFDGADLGETHGAVPRSAPQPRRIPSARGTLPGFCAAGTRRPSLPSPGTPDHRWQTWRHLDSVAVCNSDPAGAPGASPSSPALPRNNKKIHPFDDPGAPPDSPQVRLFMSRSVRGAPGGRHASAARNALHSRLCACRAPGRAGGPCTCPPSLACSGRPATPSWCPPPAPTRPGRPPSAAPRPSPPSPTDCGTPPATPPPARPRARGAAPPMRPRPLCDSCPAATAPARSSTRVRATCRPSLLPAPRPRGCRGRRRLAEVRTCSRCAAADAPGSRSLFGKWM